MGAIAFVRWLLKTRSIVAMGGSLTQAQNVYAYFQNHCYSEDAIVNGLPDEPTMKETKSDRWNYFKAVPASQKQVRGPHPDDLIIDEACEAKDELILSALPMVSSSPDPLVVMTSTFHKIFGLFQETWDQADEFGYVRLSWDIFDVVKEFSPDIWKDEQLLREVPDLTIQQAGDKSLEHRIAGRTGDPEGWVPIKNIIQAWREKTTLDWFDVEYMGSRPSSAGLINAPEDVDACTVPTLKNIGYTLNADMSAGIDWGFEGMTAFVTYMAWKNGIKVNLEAKTWTQTRSEAIIAHVVETVDKYKIPVIYADSSHPFENKDLQNALNKHFNGTKHRCAVIEVPFVSEKEDMLGNYRAHFQRHLLRIPKHHTESLWQHKRYRYQKNSDKPMKEHDHIPDATMLSLSRWKLTKQASSLSAANINQKQIKKISTITGGLRSAQF